MQEKNNTVDIWEKFIENQNFDDEEIREEILNSWMRCKKTGVNPYKGCGVATHTNIKKLMKENQHLLEVAKPVMKDILDIVEGSGFAIVLADAKGYILEVLAETDMMVKMQSLSFLPGYLWTEDMVGTNAIGTAIYIDRPIQTIGPEHYCKYQHSWTCSAAPIRDINGNLIGCIDMSGDSKKAHSHTLGIVKVAAQSIEKQLALIESHQIIHTALESILEGVIVLDNNLKVIKTNQRAIELLGMSELDIRAFDFADIKSLLSTDLGKQIRFEWKFNFKNRVIRTMISIATYGEKQGWVLTLNEPKKMHKWANKLVGFTANYTFDSIITKSYKMKKLIELAQKTAEGSCNILIEGESGTGKELLAQSIHNASANGEGPFVAVNCASIPRELVESELFGYEKGAFTGASKEGHPGKFELADGGTIFLDEIGELPLDIQSKLLRVLDNNKITRIGGIEEKQLDIRVIGATNRILEEEIKLKNFRSDLYYRLTVMKLHIPPLRERLEDIELLVYYFIRILNEKQNKNKKIEFDYIETLCQFSWPGNIRELRNTVERDYHLSDCSLKHHTMQLEKYIMNGKIESKIIDNKEIFKLSLEEAEKAIIQKNIEISNGNLTEAAKRLKIGRTTLYRKIKKYDIDVSQ